ncbi:hypothetical protein CF327_g4689 [Tilletia walkeri]|nr:hypothetical protein CF327_g4689 [Tilletia walkeri]
MSLRSGRFFNIKQAYDDLALLIFAKHHLRPNSSSPMRPWTQLCYVYRQTPHRLDGGYFMLRHIDPEGGHWVEAIPQAGAGQYDHFDDDDDSEYDEEEDDDDDEDDQTVTITDYHAQSQGLSRSATRRQQREAGIEDVLSLFSELSLNHSKLVILQMLLRALNVNPANIPTTVTQCRKLLATIHVIIWDVVRKLRDPTSNFKVHRYRSFEAFRRGLARHPLGFFPRERAKEENLRDLLRDL